MIRVGLKPAIQIDLTVGIIEYKVRVVDCNVIHCASHPALNDLLCGFRVCPFLHLINPFYHMFRILNYT